MKAIDILYLAKQDGIDIVLNEDQLQLKFPENKDINDSLLEQIKANKQLIIEYLSDNNWKSKAVNGNYNKVSRLDRAPVQRIPLSFSQERLWFIDQLEGSVQYHSSNILRLNGKIDKDALEASIQTIVNRHEILRTVVREENGEFFQYIKDKNSWQLNMVDGFQYKNDTQALHQYINKLINEPFNLSKDDMIRVHLISLNDQEQVLVVIIHHIASDGWSWSVFIKELTRFYKSYTEDQPILLGPLELQYADYAIWQRQYIEGELLDKNIRYWKEKLEDVAPLQLPTDYHRPTVQNTKGTSASFNIDKQLSEQLQQLSKRQGTTLFMTLLSAYNVLLYRYSGQQDICVGTSIADRQKEVEGLIGFFVNTLALRNKVSGEATFTELLQQVRSTTLEAYEHQEVPFEKVVEAVVKDRDKSRHPLFQVMLVLNNSLEIPQLRLGNVVASREVVAHNSSKFDLTFFVIETPPGLEITVAYNTDLFNKRTIARMMGHYKELLFSIVKEPLQLIGKLQMLTKREEQQLIEEFNNTSVIYPKDKSIVDLFEEQVVKTPDVKAIVFEKQQLSYKELNERANQLAHYLIHKGLKQEALVPICIERGLEMIVGILGILKAGGAYVPIDPEYPAERIRYMLEDTRASIVVSSKASRLKLQAAEGVEIIEMDGDWPIGNCKPACPAGSLSTVNCQPVVQPHHLAYVIYTSGSTGKPKGVMIEHKSLVDYLFGLRQKIQIDKCYSFALVSSITTDLGNTVLYSSLIFGGTLHLFSKEAINDSEILFRYFSEHTIDCLKIVPSHWKALSIQEKLLLPAKLLIFGGEALQAELAENIRLSGAGCSIINHYGPTETTIGKLLHVVNSDISYNATIPIGKPFSNTQAYILSKDLELCPVGVPGELYIAGDGLARGYFNHNDLTHSKFIRNPFGKNKSLLYRTGDLVKYLHDGNIEFIGRIDQQVKIRGYRIELGEIESVLQQSGLLRGAVVIATGSSNDAKRLVAYIVTDGFFDQEGIESYLRTELPEYMTPTQWIELDALPLMTNGKIDRKALPDPNGIAAIGDQYIAPRNDLENRLASIWQELLEVEQVSIHDNFFKLGGHSLLAIQLISVIRKRMEVEVSIGDIFDYPTIELLAPQFNDKSNLDILPPIKLQPRPERVPLSFSQERLWFIDQLEGSVQYHRPEVWRLNGELDKDALSFAFQMIVNRHEVLRSVILGKEEGLPYQHIKAKNEWQLVIIDGAQYQHDPQNLQRYIEDLIKHPFDLATDDMLRAHLIILNEQEHILVITMHHIASDGSSHAIFIKELTRFYKSYTEDHPILPDPLELQYADYAIWQRQYLHGELLDNKIKYWKEKLEGVVPLQLPTDYARPAEQSTKGSLTSFTIDKSISKGLQLLSQQQGTTLYMTLLAVFKVMLHRYSGQQDICVGSPVANRSQQEVEGLIGFFVNTLALRSEVKSEASFTELLQQVRVTMLEAFEHQDVPFEKVVEAVVKERDLSRNPLFQVLFVLQNNSEVPEFRLGNVQLKVEEFRHDNSKFDISFFITETANGLKGSVEYATDLFNEQTIVWMTNHFKELLSSIVKAPHQKIGELSMLTKAEEHQLLVEFNDTKVDYPKDKTIVDLFEEQAEKTPAAIAVVFEEEQLSYQQLNEKANQLAHYLRSRGVKEETLVPICIERSLEMIVGILGILKAGAAYVPIDPEYPEERISYMLEDTGAAIVVSSKESRSKLKTAEGIEIIEMDANWLALNGQLSTANGQRASQLHHLAYVIYTSGSTGRPKGVMNQHNGVVNRLCWAQDYYKLTSEDSVLQKTTFSFDVSVWELLWPLLAGAKLVFAKPGGHKDNGYLKSIIESSKITMLHFVPSMLSVFLPDVETGDCKSLRKVLCSGEALKQSHVELFKEKLPEVELHNLYGPTEAAIDVTYWSLSDKEKEIKIVPIGRPVANTNIYILDKQQNLVPIGVAGEIYIGGVQVARGYLNRPELTSEKFIADHFNKDEIAKLYKTGDLGKWLADGNIDYLGRMDEQVKIRGFRIELGEIETVLQQSGLVNEVIVLAKEDRIGNKKLVGYVVPVEKFDKEITIAYLKNKLPDYMIPGLWFELENLPLTPNGKLDRNALPDPDASELFGSQYVPPRNDVEEKLVAIWQELLGAERVGIHDNFFELGGHSLLAMKVISAIRKKMQVEVTIKYLFQFNTITDLSKYVEIQINQLPSKKNLFEFELLNV